MRCWICGGNLCSSCSPSHPVHTVLLPPRGWLTFDDWQACGLRYRHGTSSAWFHSASPQPSSLVSKKCRSSIEDLFVWECSLKLSLSLTQERNALSFNSFKCFFFLNGRHTLYITFDFFGEFDPVRVCERTRLLIYVVNVQHFTHELNDRLGLVKGSCRHCKIKDSFKLTTTY